MMKNFLLYPVIISIVLPFHLTSAHANQHRILQSYGKVPLAFTINNGQYDPQVKFTTRGSGCTMFFTQEGTTFLCAFVPSWQGSFPLPNVSNIP